MHLPSLPQELASVRRRLSRLLEDPAVPDRRKNSLKSGLYKRIRVLEARIAGRDIKYLVRGARPGRPTDAEQAVIASIRKLEEAKAAVKAEYEGGLYSGEVH